MTFKQNELLSFIQQFQDENKGTSPSFEEMKDAIQIKSKSGVHRLLAALEERGKITRPVNRARAISVTPDQSLLESFPTAALISELARRGHENRRAA